MIHENKFHFQRYLDCNRTVHSKKVDRSTAVKVLQIQLFIFLIGTALGFFVPFVKISREIYELPFPILLHVHRMVTQIDLFEDKTIPIKKKSN